MLRLRGEKGGTTVKLSDQDPMPCGAHQGTKMQAVPAKYLDWLDGQPWLKTTRNPEWQAVREYINENRDAIQADIPDD